MPEPLRTSVAPGTPMTVQVDGTDRAWQARVRYVSSDAAFTPYYALDERDRSRLSYFAEVDLTEEEAATLPTGMPVEALLAGAPAP